MNKTDLRRVLAAQISPTRVRSILIRRGESKRGPNAARVGHGRRRLVGRHDGTSRREVKSGILRTRPLKKVLIHTRSNINLTT